MAHAKKVSGKTHTKQQLNDYANQCNPNNKAYKANAANKAQMRKENTEQKTSYYTDLDWMCFSKGPYEFD